MDRHGWFGATVEQAPAVERSLLHAVHPESHVAAIEELCARGGGFIDADTAAVPDTWRGGAARGRRCGGAGGRAAERAGEHAASPALRPPGHHADARPRDGLLLLQQRRGGGRGGPSARGVERVAILDWDVHHGNGTEAHLRGRPATCCSSRCTSGRSIPAPARRTDIGGGAGEGYTVNLPLPGGIGDDDVRRRLPTTWWCPLIEQFAPELLLVSAGFDAHRDDPLAGMARARGGFGGYDARRWARVRRGSAPPLGLVLEGGYDAGRARALDGGVDAGAGGGHVAARRRCGRASSARRPDASRGWRGGRGWAGASVNCGMRSESGKGALAHIADTPSRHRPPRTTRFPTQRRRRALRPRRAALAEPPADAAAPRAATYAPSTWPERSCSPWAAARGCRTGRRRRRSGSGRASRSRPSSGSRRARPGRPARWRGRRGLARGGRTPARSSTRPCPRASRRSPVSPARVGCRWSAGW